MSILTASAADPLELVAPRDSDEFARFRRLACRVVGAPAAYIYVADEESAAAGIPGTPAIELLCTQVVREGRAVAIGELRPGWGEGRHPSVGAPRAFLGVPLQTADSLPLGALCVVDVAARGWTAEEEELLRDVATLVARELILGRQARDHRVLENLVRTLGKAVENMQLGVTVTDMSGRIVYTNPAEARMHGYEVAELVGEHARVFGPPSQGRAMDREVSQETSSWTRETVNVRKDGSRFPVLLWSDMVTDSAGQEIGIVTCCEDITERKRSEQALRDVALRDPLTALPNRVYFLERLTHAIQRQRHSEDARFAVLFLDLDRFKVVNDSLGHHVGDELLTVIAKRLQSCLRPTDTVARFGGDEFAILLEEIESQDCATQIAERIHNELAVPIHLDGYELFTSASIGIVLSSVAMDQPEYLWRSADMAMYRAKAAGTGRYEIFDRAMHADALARLQLETDLRRAVERQEFQLYYQPVVDLRRGGVVGFEALLRWAHPLRGVVGPAEVIPTAEETGLILPIGEWVVHEAAEQLARWQRDYGRSSPLWIGVNLSGKQLSQPNLVDQVERAIRESGIQPHSLKLEITESAVVENTENAAQILRALKGLGVQLFMDDFGTGYSSLSYLHRLPLDALKIDRSFVSQMERGDKHAQLVETIVSLARSVRLRVVAEGVTTREQLQILRELDCDLGQGFLFSTPLPVEGAADLVARPQTW